MHHPDALINPCINICRMDLANRYCQGCARTRLEIGRWAQMSEAERTQVLAAAPGRRGQRAATGSLP
ncbi:MAG: DUF1289 domain-containing protein [Cupriavidus necator]